VDREHRIEQMREADAVRLRDEAEERAIAVEAPRETRSTISMRGSSCR
jgi:hypothetical protein